MRKHGIFAAVKNDNILFVYLGMKSFDIIIEQLLDLRESAKLRKNDNVVLNLQGNNISEEYFEKVKNATNSLVAFYVNYINANKYIQETVFDILGSSNHETLKLCVLMDVIRCYKGLNHPTSFNTCEGMALMVLFSNILQIGEIEYYEDLNNVDSVSLSLIEIIPYIVDFSKELGKENTLLLSSIIETLDSEKDITYRKLIYSYCKAVAEVDGVIDISEKEWLETIARLDDEDKTNDIDITDLA